MDTFRLCFDQHIAMLLPRIAIWTTQRRLFPEDVAGYSYYPIQLHACVLLLQEVHQHVFS